MEEVPGSEESLLALDQQPALTGQNEEGLLIRLGVVDAALAGLEYGHIDPELRELDRRLAVLVGEPTRRAPRLRREPLGIAHVDDKPTLRDGGKPGAGVFKLRFVHRAAQARARSRAARSAGSPCVGSTSSTGLSSSGLSPVATSSTVTPSGSQPAGISSPVPRLTSVSPAITARIRSLHSTRSSWPSRPGYASSPNSES